MARLCCNFATEKPRKMRLDIKSYPTFKYILATAEDFVEGCAGEELNLNLKITT